MKKVSYLNAVRDGIAEEMRKDPTIFMIGEGISERGGSYAQTKDLWAEFGDERIVDAPISENGWAALSVGAAENGLRPIMDIMICDIINEMGAQILTRLPRTAICPTDRSPPPSSSERRAAAEFSQAIIPRPSIPLRCTTPA